MDVRNRGAANKRRGKRGPSPGHPPEPVLYNFHRPDKFSKDHMRSIQTIQELFCRFAANFLGSSVRSAVNIELERLEQSTVGEYVDRLPVPTVMFVSELDPLPGNVIFQMDRNLALVTVDRLLGGEGTGKHDRGNAPVTEIEMLLLEDLGRGLIGEFIAAWDQVAPLQLSRCDVALSPPQIQGALPTGVAVILRHDVRMLEAKGKLTICLPASTLEPLMPRLNARLLFANLRPQTGDGSTQALIEQMENALLTLRVEVGRATLRIAELLTLEVGDVIRLDSAANSPFVVKAGDRDAFLAQPGQQAGHLAVRIVDFVDNIQPEYLLGRERE